MPSSFSPAAVCAAHKTPSPCEGSAAGFFIHLLAGGVACSKAKGNTGQQGLFQKTMPMTTQTHALQAQRSANAESQRLQQQAQAAPLEAEISPPVSSGEAEFEQMMATMTERGRIAWAGIGNASEWVDELRGNTDSQAELAHLSPLALLNRPLHPMQILDLTGIEGLREATAESGQAVKAALIRHIEQAIPA